jgi:hypothetical protein
MVADSGEAALANRRTASSESCGQSGLIRSRMSRTKNLGQPHLRDLSAGRAESEKEIAGFCCLS